MRSSSLALICIISCLFIGICAQEFEEIPLNLVLLDEFERAKCLDGTSPGYYYREGNGDGKNSFLIHLQGGAWCQGSSEDEILQDCIKRSQTILGSSSNWPESITNTANIATSPILNPAFFNWNVAYVYYCDGFAYQGNSQRTFSNTTLYFRGKDNMISLFQHFIQKRGLLNAERVTFSGSSAGGIGAVNWTPYLKSLLPQNIKFSSVIDSGFFPDDGWFNPKYWRQSLDISYDYNREEIVPAGCEYLYSEEELYKCVQPAYTYKNLNTPALLLLSSYDAYVLLHQKNVKCLKISGQFFSFYNCTDQQWELIDQLRDITISSLLEVTSLKPNISVWTVSCINHMFVLENPFYEVGLFTSPYPEGVSVVEAISHFLEQPEIQRSYIDYSKYPENWKCSFGGQGPNSFLNQ